MSKCLIISGGQYNEISPEEVKEASFIIACDKGYEYAKTMNIEPDIILGDFDSYDGEVPNSKKVIKYKEEKDYTDTMIALKLAISKGYKNVDIYCALGDRVDHMYSNICLLHYAINRAVKCRLIGKDDVLFVLKDEEQFIEKMEGYSLSVFSVTDISKKVTITGAKYELEKSDMKNDYPIGVSNEWDSESVRISVEKGIVLIICSRLTDIG